MNALVTTQTETFRIRAARRGDGEAIGSLLRELGYAPADLGTVHWVSSHPEMEILVASDSRDRPIGLVTLSHRPQLRMNGRIATIDELVVTASWRRRGVGRALLRRAVERAKVLSVKRVEILSHCACDDAALAFFESCGFHQADAAVMRLADLEFHRH